MVFGTHRSIEAIPLAWLRRNVLQPCDGGRLRRAMYFATEVCPTSMPSFRSSPWMRGAPQRGLARLISRISRRISLGTFGRPRRRRDLHRQKARKPARRQRRIVFGLNDRECIENAWCDPIEQHEDQPIANVKPSPFR